MVNVRTLEKNASIYMSKNKSSLRNLLYIIVKSVLVKINSNILYISTRDQVDAINGTM